MKEWAYACTARENFSYELAERPKALMTSMPFTYSTAADDISLPVVTVRPYHSS